MKYFSGGSAAKKAQFFFCLALPNLSQIFRANRRRSQFLVLVFFLNDGSNSKSHFLNENKNDDGFLASLGANRRRSYFHSVFHILILTIVPESKN